MVKCKICNKEFSTNKQLSWHVKHHGLNNKEYYDMYLKGPNEGICLTCGKNTTFISMNLGYHQHCNKKCMNLNKDVQTKRLNTNLKKYGYKTSFSTKEAQEKVKQTILTKYGTKNIWASDYGKQKIKETNLEKYGCENPQQNYEIHKRTKKMYKYDNIYFDSSWELAIYIYCIDHKISIKREPIRCTYIDNKGKTRYYFPDFIINNELVEIKGCSLLDGNYIKISKSKLQCIEDHNVHIWYKEDIKIYLDYCITKFNNKYWYNNFK